MKFKERVILKIEKPHLKIVDEKSTAKAICIEILKHRFWLPRKFVFANSDGELEIAGWLLKNVHNELFPQVVGVKDDKKNINPRLQNMIVIAENIADAGKSITGKPLHYDLVIYYNDFLKKYELAYIKNGTVFK